MKIFKVSHENGSYEFPSLEEAQAFLNTEEGAGLSITEVDVAEPTPALEYFNAEEWIAAQNFSAIRLVTLLDLESKLLSANKVSPKLAAVRAWINGVLSAFVQDPTPKSDWPVAPHTFEETTQEAFALLST